MPEADSAGVALSMNWDERGLLEAVVASSDDAIVSCSLDGDILSWNPAAERLYGYSANEILGGNVAVLLPPDRRHELAAVLRRVRHGERIERLETRECRKDGTEVEVLLSVSAVRDPSGAIVGASAITRDIAELRSVEARLRESEQEYLRIFNATGDGLVINDMDGALVEANPAFCRMHGYTREEILRLHPSVFIHPDYHDLFRGYVEAVRSGGSLEARAVDVRKDGSAFPIGVHGSLFNYKGGPHILGVVRDITEQVEAERLLEQRVFERTHELASLLQVSRSVGSTLDLSTLLSLILNQLRLVADYAGAAVLLVERDELRFVASRRPAKGDEYLSPPLKIPNMEAFRGLFADGRQCVIIPDVRGDTELALAYRTTVGDRLGSDYSYVRSWLGVPLTAQDRMIGLIVLAQSEPDFYTGRHAQLALGIASQAAVAIENARLYEEAQESARKTAALAQIAAGVALGGSLETTLDGLAQSVVLATGAAAAAVVLIEGDPPLERMVGTYGLGEGWGAAFDEATHRGARSISARALRKGQPVVLRQAREAILALPEWEPLHPFIREAPWDSYASLPLVARENKLGTLAIFFGADEEPSEERLVFLSAVADQAAVAVENARLFAEAQGKAALEERQRLARELHDSVSQALYGIALGARTARTLVDREPTRAVEPLDYVLSLAEAGLAEMRALIFELRPESLEREGLVAAIERLALLLRARHSLSVTTALCPEPAMRHDCREALYRIAQEALNNVVKHAHATRVRIKLTDQSPIVSLEIEDDGSGFDPSGDFPGHLGLRSMRERATRLGGSLDIDSAPGHGTRVRVQLP
jgi:PAS domain S-box-containing protein